jgi:acetyltransferase, GNAT family
MKTNEFEQVIGEAVPGVTPGGLPTAASIEGRYTRLEKLNESHKEALYAVYGPDTPAQMWTYLAGSSVANEVEWDNLFERLLRDSSKFYYVILDKNTQKALGTFALMRLDTANRVVEIGSVTYLPELQRTRMATEAQYLMARYVFEEMGYRRYEWKCDALNEPWKRAAKRLGFTYEGRFRQAVVYKGRTRDTDWYSMIDQEWPKRKERFEKWLLPENFNEEGVQYHSLSQQSL